MNPFAENINSSAFIPKRNAEHFSLDISETGFIPKRNAELFSLDTSETDFFSISNDGFISKSFSSSKNKNFKSIFSFPKKEEHWSHEAEEKIANFKVYSTEFLLSLKECKPNKEFEFEIPDPFSYRKKRPVRKRKIIKTEESSFVKSQKIIRKTLNELTEANFEKLGLKLVNNIIYNPPLLRFLIKLIFERAIFFIFPDLYAELCGFMRKEFIKTNNELGKMFRIELIELCYKSFYEKDPPKKQNVAIDTEEIKKIRKIGIIKFIGLLYKQKMLRADIIYECFYELLKIINDLNVESFCLLFEECANILASEDSKRLEIYFEKVVSLQTSELLSKRIKFKILELIDKKDSLFNPNIGKPTSSSIEITYKQELPPSQAKTKKKHLDSSSKKAIQKELRGFFYDYDFETRAEKLKVLFQNLNKIFCIGEIFKFTLLKFHEEENLRKLCDLLKILHTEKNCVTGKGLTLGIENAIDYNLEYIPESPKMLSFCVNELQDLLIKNPKLILSRLNKKY